MPSAGRSTAARSTPARVCATRRCTRTAPSPLQRRGVDDAAGHRRARDRRRADGRRRPARGHLRDGRRRQVDAAGHAGAPGARPTSTSSRWSANAAARCASSSTRASATTGLARSVVVVSTSDRPALERVRAAYAATAIAEGFRARGQARAAAGRFGDALRARPARARPVGAGAAGAARLSAVGVRRAAAPVRARRQRRARLDHRLLHRARRGRRQQRPGGRGSALDPRRPHRAVARAGAGAPLPGDRRAGQREPRVHARRRRRAPRGGRRGCAR